MIRIFFISFCWAILFLTGCKKFLNVQSSTTKINPTTITDLEEILNSDSLVLCNFITADLMGDDVQIGDAELANDTSYFNNRAYLWKENIWNPGDADIMYNTTYTRLLQLNVVLSKIDNVEGSSQKKNILRAQAKINRAWYYLQLVNLYGKDYQESTAATDLAVPLILTPDAAALPARATVEEVYKQILLDLESAVAVPDLPVMGGTVVQPGKAAGYALLARSYLYRGDYLRAEAVADSALAIYNSLLNYNNNYRVPNVIADLKTNPEILFGKLAKFSGTYAQYVPNSLFALFDANDVRRTAYFNISSAYPKMSSYKGSARNYCVTVPEVILIKAECLARTGDAEGALTLLNQLRKNRLVQYVALTDITNILTTVLREKRRELCNRGGIRLFDLKRLNRDPQYATVLHRVALGNSRRVNYGDTLTTLAPNSPRYLMPFSPLVIANNPNMLQNPR